MAENVEFRIDVTGNAQAKLNEMIKQQKIANAGFEDLQGKAAKSTTAATDNAGKIAGAYDKAKTSIVNAATGIGIVTAAIAGAGYAVLKFARQTAEMEGNAKALRVASGSTREYVENLQFLNAMQAKYGVSIQSSREGLMSFSAATKGTALQGEKTRKIFEAVTVASSSMGLSNERQSLVFQALGQMASKGVISMEELRQQLGESLPGALNIAAKSMNMTTGEFTKMVSEGKVLANDFLPKFAEELKKSFAAGFDPQSLTNNLTKIDNAFKTLSESIGVYFSGIVANFSSSIDIIANNVKIKAVTKKAQSELDKLNYAISIIEDKNAPRDEKEYYKQYYEGRFGKGINLESLFGQTEARRKLVRESVIPSQNEIVAAREKTATDRLIELQEVRRKHSESWFERFTEPNAIASAEASYKASLKAVLEAKKDLKIMIDKWGLGEATKQTTEAAVVANTKTTDTDRFSGTTITARAPQTFNIRIDELNGIKELNTQHTDSQISKQTGNLVLEELMKAVAQVQMLQRS
jgi:tape measure domain-containing protein